MKNLKNLSAFFLVLVITVAFVPTDANAQKFAYVDTEYILSNIPEYTDAQDELDALSKKWQNEIDAKHKQISEMYKKYQAEVVLLPEDVKKKREDEIVAKEKETKDLQKKYFGPEGKLFKKRQELIQPIQEKVFNAIETIATTRNIGMVFDKAGAPVLLFGDPKYDISDDVLDEVGNVMQTVKRDQRKRKN